MAKIGGNYFGLQEVFSMRPAYAGNNLQDEEGYGFDRVFTTLHSGAASVFDASSHFAGETEGLDKSLKLARSTILAFQVHYASPKLLAALQSRLWSLSDTIAGLFNTVQVIDFFANTSINWENNAIDTYFMEQKKDKKGNPIIVNGEVCYKAVSSWKVAGKVLLAVGNVAEFLIMLRSFGVELGKAAAAVGNLPVLRIFVNAGLSTVKNTFVVASCILTIIDYTKTVLNMNSRDFERKKAFLSLFNDLGKIGMIAFSSCFFTYAYAAMCIGTNVIALTKIYYSRT